MKSERVSSATERVSLATEWVVIRLSALGDLALTTGVLEYWRKTRGWRFTVITREGNGAIFDGHPAVSEVIGLRDEELHMPVIMRRFRDIAREYAGKGLIDLHGTPRTRLLSMLWRGDVRRYRKMSLERRLHLLSHGRWFQKELSEINVPQRYALAIEETPPQRSDLLPRLFLSEQERLRGQKLAPAHRPFVAIHPYATHLSKTWKTSSWLRLVGIFEERELPWLVIGRGTPLAGLDSKAYRFGHDLTNQTSLRETCGLLQTAGVLVTGDSGPMHLAAGVDTPVVALFGPTTAAWGFFPAGVRDRVLESDLSCRPCTLHGKRECPDNQRCMNAISPESVFDAVQGVLSESAG